MILCPHCKTSNRDGSNFCNECGQRLNRAVAPPLVDDQPANTGPVAPVARVEPAPAPPQPAPPTQPRPTAPPPPPTGCGGCSLMLLVCLVLAGVVTIPSLVSR